MEEKLNKLYDECIKELSTIGIDASQEKLGQIDIKIAKRNCKRYGCCKQEEPDKTTAYRKNRIVYYKKFNKHHIEISKWVMSLNNKTIKNTILHEIIHCFPDCNNHGKQFKEYAELINKKLGYNISRLGNKQEDYKKSNLEYRDEALNYKYKIICENCEQTYFRQRLSKNFSKKFRCGICKGKLKILNY